MENPHFVFTCVFLCTCSKTSDPGRSNLQCKIFQWFFATCFLRCWKPFDGLRKPSHSSFSRCVASETFSLCKWKLGGHWLVWTWLCWHFPTKPNLLIHVISLIILGACLRQGSSLGKQVQTGTGLFIPVEITYFLLLFLLFSYPGQPFWVSCLCRSEGWVLDGGHLSAWSAVLRDDSQDGLLQGVAAATSSLCSGWSTLGGRSRKKKFPWEPSPYRQQPRIQV